jgi:hypothetical protein
MRSAWLPLVVFSAGLCACGAAPDAPRPAPAPPAAASGLIHAPPIDRLNAQQLRALSMECEKYSPDKSARGPYDAAYCEQAVAAWSDAPLQMIPLDKNTASRQP